MYPAQQQYYSVPSEVYYYPYYTSSPTLNQESYPVQQEPNHEVMRSTSHLPIEGGALKLDDLIVKCSRVCSSGDRKVISAYVADVEKELRSLSTYITQLENACKTAKSYLFKPKTKATSNTANEKKAEESPKQNKPLNDTTKKQQQASTSKTVTSNEVVKNGKQIKAVKSDVTIKGNNGKKTAKSDKTVKTKQQVPPKQAKGSPTQVQDVSKPSGSASNSNSPDSSGEPKTFYITEDRFVSPDAIIAKERLCVRVVDGKCYFPRKYNKYLRHLTKPPGAKGRDKSVANGATVHQIGGNDDLSNTFKAPSLEIVPLERPVEVPELRAPLPDPQCSYGKDVDWSAEMSLQQVRDGFYKSLIARLVAYKIEGKEKHAACIHRVCTSELNGESLPLRKALPDESLTAYLAHIASITPADTLFETAYICCIIHGDYTEQDLIEEYFKYLSIAPSGVQIV